MGDRLMSAFLFFMPYTTCYLPPCYLISVVYISSWLGRREPVLSTDTVRIQRNQKDMEEQVEMVGKAFVNHYYNLFDTDRASLLALYQPTSMLTFEGQKILGVNDISAKLNQLPFDQCRHVISTIDSQPSSSTGGGIVVFVSGSLQLSGEEHHLRFSQMFHLISTPEGSFFVQNDIFRLNYG